MTPSDRQLARRYARAYLAAEDKIPPAENLARLKKACAAIGGKLHHLKNPLLPFSLKREILGETGDSAFAFLSFLLRAGRFGLLDEIVKETSILADEADNIMRARVTSASELSENSRSGLEAGLAGYSGKTVRATYEVNPDLIGGVQVRMGDTFIDGSLKTRFKILKDTLSGN